MVARKRSTVPTRLWSFGRRLDESAENVDRAWSLIRGATDYYNALLALHTEQVASYREIREQYAPELTVLRTELEIARADVAEWRAQLTALPRNSDRRTLLRKELKQFIEHRRQVSAREKAARQAVEGALAEARATLAERIAGRCGPSTDRTVGPRIVERVTREEREAMWDEEQWSPMWVALDRHETGMLARRKLARAECGLPPGCYMLVEKALQAAISAARPLLPSPRSVSKPSRIGVQVTGTVTWGDVVHGRCPAVRIDPAPHYTRITREGKRVQLRGGARLKRIGIRVACMPDVYVWALAKMYREPDADSVVKWAWIYIRREGTRLVCQTQFTLEHPAFDEPKRPPGIGHVTITPCCEIDERGIAVARWFGDDGNSGAVVVPAQRLGKSRGTKDALLARLVYTEAWTSALDSVHATALHVLDPGSTDKSLPARRGLERLVAYYCEQRWGRDELRRMWRSWIADRRAADPDADLIDRPGAGVALDEWWPETTAAWVREHVDQATDADVRAWWAWTFVEQSRHLCRERDRIRVRSRRQRDAIFRAEAIRLTTAYETATIDKPRIAPPKRQRDDRDPALREVLHLVGVATCAAIVREAFGRRRVKDGVKGGELSADDGKALRELVDRVARDSGQARRRRRRRPARERSGGAASAEGARSRARAPGSSAEQPPAGDAE